MRKTQIPEHRLLRGGCVGIGPAFAESRGGSLGGALNSVPEETLYTCLIEEQTNDGAFVQVYWARGSHMGEAIERALAMARQNDLTNPSVREADPFDIENLACEVYPDAGAVAFFSTTRYSFPPEPAFSFPAGIIPSGMEDEDEEADDVNEIREGYRRTKQDDGLIEIGVNVEQTDLLALYARLLHLRDSYETFWYVIHDHWDDGETLFFENNSLRTAEAILEHLHKNPDGSILNGFVTLTAYFEEGATNLSISDHKRLIVLTYSDGVADAFEAALNSEGYPANDELVSFDTKIHHWHYRPSVSCPREEMIGQLISQGFNPWNPNEGVDETMDLKT